MASAKSLTGGRNGSLSVLSSGEPILKGNATVMIQSKGGNFKKISVFIVQPTYRLLVFPCIV
jgi:hypothetical protein